MRARLTVMLLLVAACGKSDEQKAAEAAAKQMGEALAAAGAAGATGAAAAAGALTAGKATDAVDFRVLKELLPEEINGMPRTSSDGEKNSAMGFTMSRAEARYETQGTNASIRIEISDAGAMTGMAAMAAFAAGAIPLDGFPLPALALTAGLIGGGLYAIIPGLLKVRLNVNEVIAARARGIGAIIQAEDGVGAACDAIEEAALAHRAPGSGD